MAVDVRISVVSIGIRINKNNCFKIIDSFRPGGCTSWFLHSVIDDYGKKATKEPKESKFLCHGSAGIILAHKIREKIFVISSRFLREVDVSEVYSV